MIPLVVSSHLADFEIRVPALSLRRTQRQGRGTLRLLQRTRGWGTNGWKWCTEIANGGRRRLLVPLGAKARADCRSFRGAEAPLFHGTTGIRVRAQVDTHSSSRPDSRFLTGKERRFGMTRWN